MKRQPSFSRINEYGWRSRCCRQSGNRWRINFSHDVTVLLPAMYLMGNPVQNVGRCLGTAEVNAKYYPHIITVCVINALLSIWVMQLIV